MPVIPGFLTAHRNLHSYGDKSGRPSFIARLAVELVQLPGRTAEISVSITIGDFLWN